MSVDSQVCKDCGEDKPFTEYRRVGTGGRWRSGYCHPCRQARDRAAYHKDADKRRVSMKAWRTSRPYWSTANDLGCSEEEIAALFEGHDGLCSICRKPEVIPDGKGQPKRLAVDHCHHTGALRGLLCQTCNVGIGNLQDSIQMLETAIEYLRSYQFCTA